MFRFSTLVAVAALCCASAASACTGADVSLQVLPFEVTQDFSLEIPELRRAGMGALNAGAVVAKTWVSHRGCTATVGYRNAVLYVAREVQYNKCAFDSVLAHEEEHVRIYREALKQMEEHLRARTDEFDLVAALNDEFDHIQSLQSKHDVEDQEMHRRGCNGAIRKAIYGH